MKKNTNEKYEIKNTWKNLLRGKKTKKKKKKLLK